MEQKSKLPNSEILLVYQAKMCNPNGDPDDENKPRMDPKTNTNLVSDVRLKRYFRDYIIRRFGEKHVWASKVDGKNVSSDERIEKLGIEAEDVPTNCIDARLFGATVPIRAKSKTRKQATPAEEDSASKKGKAVAFTGPVQFSWGFSLHPVDLVDSSTITSLFVGRESKGEEAYGTMGKDWRLYYSLIAFYGIVSGRRAAGTGMSEDDLKLLDNCLWKALQVEPTTRSKIGESPLLYLRVEYADADTILGDFRACLSVQPKSPVRKLEDVEINFAGLIEKLNNKREKIARMYLYSELPDLTQALAKSFGNKLVFLPHPLDETKILQS